MKIGKYKFTRVNHPYYSGWEANGGRLIVRRSVIRPTMFCADYKVGRDLHTVLRNKNGRSRRFYTKEKAAAVLIKFWEAL